MYKQSCTNLLDLPEADVKKWLDSFDSVITDCDGVVWLFNNPIEGSVETINKFKEINKKVFFCTNNSTKTRGELLEKAIRLGFKMNEDEIISTAHAAAAYLKNRNFNKKVFVIGSEGITKELDALGIDHNEVGPDPITSNLNQFVSEELKLDTGIGAVIVGFDEHISFPKLTKAASYLNETDCIFLATNTDERFPMPNYVIPGTGSIVKAVETCAERDAIVIGKPNPNICESLIRDGIIKPERTLMIGDRCNTDILLGTNCGFQTLLVGSGIHQPDHVKAWLEEGTEEAKKLVPDVYLPKLGDLLKFM
ncbi:glycerol-3-phosphate phosphatase-like isoform X2 [Eupeodes corollae]|nr:glycerol-3-phosphate phosphatase-like isoform X2 [Eupeodes corollae]XP_055906279.1 glycerol-3-phosphate phosphatase-like isoform X2 [Eupeodes corollae]